MQDAGAPTRELVPNAVAGLTAQRAIDAAADLPALPAGFQRGMNLEPIGGFGRQIDLERLPDSLDRLVELGVDHVAITPSFFQRRLGDTEFTWRRSRDRVDANTRAAIAMAHARGLSVLLKPHLWLEDRSDGAWRGRIDPTHEHWSVWRASYRDALLGYATLGAEEGVAGLSIGSELTDLALGRPDFWRELAADVRSRFPGILTYGANWDREYSGISWWDALDAIGVDAFWPLSEHPRVAPSDDELADRLDAILAQIGEVAASTGRPVIITEIGYRSEVGAAFRPWEWHADDSGRPDRALQARIYAAVARALSEVASTGRSGTTSRDRVSGTPGTPGDLVPDSRRWLIGVYLWTWYADPQRGGPTDTDFTPLGKPAERVLAAWFRKRG